MNKYFLKNKKTGKIACPVYNFEDNITCLYEVKDSHVTSCIIDIYKCSDELYKEWTHIEDLVTEDGEEPKVYYYISDFGAICECEIGKFPEDEKDRKRIDNYFYTREEIEKALEILKARTRLKDSGCKPIGWRWKHDYPNDACYVEVVLKCQFDAGVCDRELDLIYGS